MKALLLATFLIGGGPPSEQVRTVTNNVIDASECKSAMMTVVKHAGLKNHIKSSGPTHIRASKEGSLLVGNTSVNVTCNPIKGE